tara:strand:- start:240 stop:644 length:405 start_codon:yes stop_codon:yes gene_type:complete
MQYKFKYILIFFLISFSAFAKNDLTDKKLLCSKILWGFDFFTSEKVRVIETDMNKNTKVREYFYETDLQLLYVNLYLIENDEKNIFYSIDLNTFKVNIWTMTSGGITTREYIPPYFCKVFKDNNLIRHIENLKY